MFRRDILDGEGEVNGELFSDCLFGSGLVVHCPWQNPGNVFVQEFVG